MTAPRVAPRARPVEKTLIEEHRWLASFAGAPHPVYSYVTAVPLLVGFLFLGRQSTVGWPLKLLEVAAGVIYWTFIEYAMHRWFYHWRPQIRWLRRFVESFHMYHHRNVPDRSVYNAGPLLALPLAVILPIPLLVLTHDVAATATMMVGTVVGYCVYEWFHYAIHVYRPRAGWLSTMQVLHMHHHRVNTRVYFGVTTIFWDRLFGSCEGQRSSRALE